MDGETTTSKFPPGLRKKLLLGLGVAAGLVGLVVRRVWLFSFFF
jgi:hypothetical protein